MKDNNKKIKNNSVEKENMTLKKKINALVDKIKEKKIYLDYKTRLIIFALLIILSASSTILLVQSFINATSSKKINYDEMSNIDYKVYLKDNNFYDSEYIEKDKVYVASIIDKILVDFKYNFIIENEADLNFSYEVIAKLTINDEMSTKNYFEKEYILVDKKDITKTNSKDLYIAEQIDVNYGYYNSLANRFRQQYGIDTTNSLNIYFKIYKESNVSDTSIMYVKIPLSEKAINIDVDYQEISNSSFLLKTNDNLYLCILIAIVAILTLIITLICVIKFVRLISLINGKKSKYDKYIEKILNEYDRLIVENSTGPNLETCNVIKIKKFEELLDVRDNLKLPIMYYVVAKHHKCYFYIKDFKDLYIVTIKAADLDDKNEK